MPMNDENRRNFKALRREIQQFVINIDDEAPYSDEP